MVVKPDEGRAEALQAYATTFDARVAGFVADAATRSAGFRRRLEQAGLQPSDLRDVASLDRLDVLTKDELLAAQHANPPFGGLLAHDAAVHRVFQSPGPIYEPQVTAGDAWGWTPALRAAGFGPTDRVLVAFGFHLSPAGAMFEAACASLGAVVLPAGVGNKDAQLRACRDLDVTAFIGPPSYLKALLDEADAAGQVLEIQRAFVTAEPLPPSLRSALEERVPVVRQGFGTAETGHLGHECDTRDGLHVSTTTLVQVCDLDSGASRYDDAEGQLVVTLFDSAYPVARFGTGDITAWCDTPCSCGATTPRIRGWLGRVGDAVKVRGMFLHPRQVSATFDGLDGVQHYQMVIEREDHRDVLRCRVVPTATAADVTATIRRAVREELRFNVAVDVVDALAPDAPVIDDQRTWD